MISILTDKRKLVVSFFQKALYLPAPTLPSWLEEYKRARWAHVVKWPWALTEGLGRWNRKQEATMFREDVTVKNGTT